MATFTQSTIAAVTILGMLAPPFAPTPLRAESGPGDCGIIYDFKLNGEWYHSKNLASGSSEGVGHANFDHGETYNKEGIMSQDWYPVSPFQWHDQC